MNDLYMRQKKGGKRGGGGMGGKRGENATRYPYSPIPFSPFSRRPQAH